MSLMDLWSKYEIDPEEGATENLTEEETENEEGATENLTEEETENEEGATENLTEEEREILNIITLIRSNKVDELKQAIRLGNPIGGREKKMLENIFVFLASAAEKEEAELAIEEDTVKAVLEKAAPYINPRSLTAKIKWDLDCEAVSGLMSSECKVPHGISEMLLFAFFEREVIPASKLMLYIALSLERSREELVGGMFISLTGCAIDSIV